MQTLRVLQYFMDMSTVLCHIIDRWFLHCAISASSTRRQCSFARQNA